ncbi:MAG: dicarboxylate/amino acid:cation symporter [Spirochaeta sp. LUC14_002_19_P3]|nr:MAG: dicarboxylate/amino acid:cation symporter [Spirochaeta sp. LUC14_002_19_P3]
MSTEIAKKKGLFDWYFKSNLLIRIFIGLLAGIFTGIIFGNQIAWLQPLGTVLVSLLKMIVMPVVLSTLVLGAASIQPSSLGKLGVKILIYYILTSVFAVGIGLLMGNIFKPGMGLNLQGSADIAGKVIEAPKLSETLVNIIPSNPFGAISSGEVLPTIFFALLLGITISILRENKDKRIKKSVEVLYSVFEALAETMYLIVNWVLQYAPIGVFALIAVVFGAQGAEVIGPLGKVTIAAFSGYILHTVFVYSGLLLLFKMNPASFFKRARTPIITAFVTRSSSGTLPVTMETMEKNFGVSRNIYSFTLPVGATINMDGTAIYQGVCAIFIGFAIGMPLSISQQLTVILTAVLASIGTAGVPAAGAIMLLMILNSIGLPMEAGSPVAAAYAMILGIDAILDMGRTSVNVTGDMTGTLIVAKSEKSIG